MIAGERFFVLRQAASFATVLMYSEQAFVVSGFVRERRQTASLAIVPGNEPQAAEILAGTRSSTQSD